MRTPAIVTPLSSFVSSKSVNDSPKAYAANILSIFLEANPGHRLLSRCAQCVRPDCAGQALRNRKPPPGIAKGCRGTAPAASSPGRTEPRQLNEPVQPSRLSQSN